MGRPLIHRLDSTGSTMELLHRLAEQGAEAGTVVVAAEQTAGRGSRGRAWRSPRGGLWMSLLVRPGRAAGDLLSLRAGLAIADGLERADPALRIGLKWPNDLMLGDRKLGGVLCEARWIGGAAAWVAVGVGINVRNPIEPGLADTATSLAELVGEATPDMVLNLILPGLRRLDAASALLHHEELAALARRDWLRGRPLASPIAGVAEGIAPDGAMRVRRPDGTRVELRAGTVQVARHDVSP